MEKYKCWDCHKEVKDVQLAEEIKKKCPKTMDGYFLIICDDCKDNEDY
jgi:DNA-directed RNA polymerase subunit RPC12/RpoP